MAGLGLWGVAGVPFTSANASAADAAVTDAPVSTKKLVVDELIWSVDTAMSVTFKEETTGTVIAGPFWMAANTTQRIAPDTGYGAKKWRLATADKKLMVRTSASGNVMVHARVHSE